MGLMILLYGSRRRQFAILGALSLQMTNSLWLLLFYACESKVFKLVNHFDNFSIYDGRLWMSCEDHFLCFTYIEVEMVLVAPPGEVLD